MPFKGDMRLGGPHDNEANLNGSSSDFDGVLAAGTVISGPTDTSRTEYDYVGQPFLMPYSTIVYADGVGGTYSTETWGLQYLPAGWVTLEYVSNYEIFVSAINQNVQAGYDTYRNVEDGTGINTPTVYSSYRPDYGTVIYGPIGEPYAGTASYYDQNTFTTETISSGVQLAQAIVYSDNGNQWDFGVMVVSGSYYPNGQLVSDQPDSQVEVPSGSGNFYFDGNDNRYEWDGDGNIVFRYSGLYPNGVFIANYPEYNYYWDGAGGYYQGEYTGSGTNYPPYGTQLGYSSGYNYTYVWQENESYVNGTYEGGDYADGMGGSYGSYSYTYIGYGGTIHVSTTRPYGLDEYMNTIVGNLTTGRSYAYAYISDGNGGYSEAMHTEPTLGSYHSLGTTAYSDGYQPNTFSLYNNGIQYNIHNGTGTYTTHYVWDGNGDIMSGPTAVGSFYPLWTPIYDEWSNHLYEVQTEYDSELNPYSVNYYLFHDGNGGWTTNQSQTP